MFEKKKKIEVTRFTFPIIGSVSAVLAKLQDWTLSDKARG